jgi:hypothetical protein
MRDETTALLESGCAGPAALLASFQQVRAGLEASITGWHATAAAAAEQNLQATMAKAAELLQVCAWM